MKQEKWHFDIYPIGDSAITLDFGNVISLEINQRVLSLYEQVMKQPFAGMTEAVACYASLTVFYRPEEVDKGEGTAYVTVRKWLKSIAAHPEILPEPAGRRITVPVCYDIIYGPDLAMMSTWANLNQDEIIAMHSSKPYQVYMIGFLPGFAYMGEVPEKIAMPRKSEPVTVAEGSIGIAGKQTGIYPLDSPGGWQIIGKTPLKVFDVTAFPPCRFRAGDIVNFKPITRREFENFKHRDS